MQSVVSFQSCLAVFRLKFQKKTILPFFFSFEIHNPKMKLASSLLGLVLFNVAAGAAIEQDARSPSRDTIARRRSEKIRAAASASPPPSNRFAVNNRFPAYLSQMGERKFRMDR